jgi:lipoate-protein ligase A
MHWRVLRYKVYSPEENMAIDEAILEAHLRGLVPPTLRFYGWSTPAVSYGYNQVLPEETAARIQAEGLDVVRRPTGGRAVLHLGEFTYSLVGSAASPDCPGFLSGSITQAYKQICEGLQGGLKRLGVDAQLGQAHAAYRQHHDCFLATTGADLHCDGKKLVGSAQLRRKHAVLQHGSLLLDQPQDLMPRLLGARSDGGSKTIGDADRHANLFEIIPRCTVDQIEVAMIAGFEEAFGIQFDEGEIAAEEIAACV